MPRPDVEQAFAGCAYRVRPAMEALPRQLAERLARLNDATAIEAVLDDAIRAAAGIEPRTRVVAAAGDGGGESNPT
ncbi:MAG: hypothetical protein U1D55_19410 [Phycisphaerae bacterium]